jgi:hypothetical protein
LDCVVPADNPRKPNAAAQNRKQRIAHPSA